MMSDEKSIDNRSIIRPKLHWSSSSSSLCLCLCVAFHSIIQVNIQTSKYNYNHHKHHYSIVLYNLDKRLCLLNCFRFVEFNSDFIWIKWIVRSIDRLIDWELIVWSDYRMVTCFSDINIRKNWIVSWNSNWSSSSLCWPKWDFFFFVNDVMANRKN